MKSARKKVILFGPKIKKAAGAYGGGSGGFTRNMSAYLNFFNSDRFRIIPSFHTIRGGSKLDFFVIRFFRDIYTYINDVLKNKPSGIHILAQYRTAIPREFMVVIISKLFSIPVLYEIKAGSFITWLESTNMIFRGMMKYTLKNSKVVLSEGIPYISYLKEKFNINAHYFPNYVPSEEVPKVVPIKLQEEKINVLFVGYAYKDKGVFELIEGCNIAAKNIPIELSLIGKESDDFRVWLDKLNKEPKLDINRIGVKSHEYVLESFNKIDVYCYPTSHKGEGHNNSINEAMMMGLIIITTRQGFLGTVLNDERAYFLDSVSPEEVAEKLLIISRNRESAQKKANLSRKHLIENFTSNVAYKRLDQHYTILTNNNHTIKV